MVAPETETGTGIPGVAAGAEVRAQAESQEAPAELEELGQWVGEDIQASRELP